MVGRGVLAMAAVLVLAGCATTVAGTAIWPGANLEKITLTGADLPPGVQFDRIHDNPGQPDGAGGPGSMLSRPAGCANALTDVIARSAQRGPGSATKYAVSYDGVRIVMTVLSWSLDLGELEATANRCAKFEAFFDPNSEGIPITTTRLPGTAHGVLAYQQTMQLKGVPSSVYMAFQNIGTYAMFGIAFPAADPTIEAKASLPQTFLDVVARQAAKIQAS